MKSLVPYTTTLLFLLTSPAIAQKDSPKPPPGISSQLQNLLGGELKPQKSNAPVPSTKFTSTGKLIFLDEMLARMNLEGEQSDQFRKYAVEVIKVVETAYKENGFEKNDLGVALGGLLEVCYEMDRGTFKLGSTDKSEDAENKAKTKVSVRQIQTVLGNTPAYKKLTDKAKQTAYEACTFTMGHLAVSWQQAGDDEEKRKAVQKMARQQIETLFKFDPDGITRNEKGEFIVKKKTEVKTDDTEEKSPPEKPTEESESPRTAQETEPQPARDKGQQTASPKGWTTQQLNNGILLLKPQNLPEDETFSLAIFPKQSLAGKPLEEWLAAAVERDPLRPGKPVAAPKIKAASGNVASGTVSYTLSGVSVLGVYNAVSVDKETVRLIRILTPPDGKLLTRYKADLSKMTSALIQADKKEAVTAGRGLDVEKLPTTPQGMSPGGSLKPGIYAGTQLYKNEVRGRYRLYLYDNGQYRMFNTEGKQINSNVRQDFQYDNRSGKLNLAGGIQFNMLNDRTNPDEDVCLFGQDAQGKPYIYARSDRGFGDATTILRYVGQLDKPSPKEEDDVKRAAEAEAKRYKWVVPAGQGLKPSQIAGVLMDQEVKQFYNGSGLSVSSTYDLYLLLADGTIYNGLPVPPDEMDVTRSRRKEPEKWGRWKRNGKAFSAAWSDAPNQFKLLKGDLVQPGSKGLRLAGRWGTGETSGTVLGGSYRLWGVSFSPDGRFIKDNRGGYGSSITAQNSGMASINTYSDDNGSVTSASGDNFFVGSQAKKKPNGDRSGTYSIDGYTLTLRYDDGRVERRPFFSDDGQKTIWFEGAVMSKDDKKKGNKG